MTAIRTRVNAGRIRTGLLLFLAGYAVLLVIVVAAMLQVRRTTLATMGTPEAQAEWQAWRESEPNQRDDLPVKRRPPKSTEPPALVLMRDYFPVLMSAAIVFSSLLYVALAIAARGVFSDSTNRERNDSPQRTQRGTESAED
jgi:hypothetical protein